MPTDNEWAEFWCNFLTVPKYVNIVLVEGTPGSGN